MKKYSPYADYKKTKSPWINSIPTHWEFKRVKDVVTYNDENLDEKTEPDFEIEYVDISSVSLTRGIENKDLMTFEKSPSRARRKVRNGDIIISTVRTYLKAIAQVRNPPDNLIVSTGFAVIRPNPSLDSRFAGYMLQSNGFVGDVVANSVGVSYPAINASDLVRLPFVEPPVIEQQKISDFLDQETSKIEALIFRKKDLLEKIEEKRSALISHAVTKGIYPNVSTKDSGSLWLGRVPSHWQVKRLKNIATWNDETIEENTDPDFEIEYVDISSVSLNKGIENIELINFENAPSRARRKVRDGDIIISTVRTYLKAITSIKNPPDNMVVSTGFAVIRPVANINQRFVGYLLQSSGFVGAVVANSVGVSYPAINASDLVRLPIVQPPIKEQEAIVQYLDREIVRIDEQFQKVEAAIEKLEEYRSTLIINAVTGKIDVRDFCPTATTEQREVAHD